MTKHLFLKISLIVAFGLSLSASHAESKADKQGWLLGMQSYSFHKFSLEEALDKTQALGIHYIEVYPGHRLGDKWGDQVFDYHLDEKTREEIKALAISKGIKIIGTGVCTTNDPDEWEKIFRFAKDFEMDFISCEPLPRDWDVVEALVKKYDIKAAVHNHPKPSDYWKPDLLLEQIATRDQRIGSAADVGHWRREELNELECMKKLDGRILSLHFKDIAEKKEGEKEQPDVIWGTGILDMKGMLKELKRQQFKGVISIEYENNLLHSLPDIKQCVEYFHQAVDELFP